MGRVTRELVTVWRRLGHEVIGCLWNHPGGKTDFVAYSIPAQKTAGFTDEVIGFLFSVLSRHSVDAIVLQGDIFYFLGLEKFRSRVFLPVIGYFNLDSMNPSPIFLNVLRNVTKVVMSSEWAKNHLKDSLNFKDASFVHHGVDTNVFHPVSTVPKEDVIIYIGQNTVRKDVISLLRAYARARQYGLQADLKIYSNFSTGEYNLVLEAARLGVLEHVKFSRDNLSDSEINVAYNSAKFFATATAGEGFCLPVLEAMACGLPVVAPAHTSLTELVKTRGRLAWTVENTNFTGAFGLEMSRVDIDSLAKQLYAMEEDLKDKETAEHLRTACISYAKEHTWEKTASFLLSQIVESRQISVMQTEQALPVDPLLFYLTKNTVSNVAVIKSGNVGDYLQLLPVIKGINRKHGVKPDIFGRIGTYVLKPYANRCFDIGLDPGIILNTIKDSYEFVYFYVTYDAMILQDGKTVKPNELLLGLPANAKLEESVITRLIRTSELTDYCSVQDLNFSDAQFDLPEVHFKEFILVAMDGMVPHAKLVPPPYIYNLLFELKKFNMPVVSTYLNLDLPVDYVIKFGDLLTEIAYAKKASLIITLDNRILWLSYAFNRPAIAIYGPTDPLCFSLPGATNVIQLTNPVCKPCWYMYSPCIYQKTICANYPTVDRIIKEVYNILYKKEVSYGA